MNRTILRRAVLPLAVELALEFARFALALAAPLETRLVALGTTVVTARTIAARPLTLRTLALRTLTLRMFAVSRLSLGGRSFAGRTRTRMRTARAAMTARLVLLAMFTATAMMMALRLPDFDQDRFGSNLFRSGLFAGSFFRNRFAFGDRLGFGFDHFTGRFLGL